MPLSRIEPIIKNLRRIALRHDGAGMTDGQLLESFVSNRDEAAFEALVRRHGPMVWGVCHRLLRNQHDAEDAFQATFLVLARKAASVFPREPVGKWLYGVAHTTAIRARVATAKQRVRERQVMDMPEPKPRDEGLPADLHALLDQELKSLPNHFRTVIVLCDLEGRTRRQVARQLKIPDGTVSSRLTAGRRMLAKKLARHGVAFSAGAIATILSQNAASACIPASLVESTVKAATLVAAGKAVATAVVSSKVTALSEGVMKAMLLTKLKTAMAVLVVLGVITFSGGLLTYHTAAAQQGPPEKSPEENRNGDRGAPKKLAEVQLKKDVFKLEDVPGTQILRYSVTVQEGEKEKKQPETIKVEFTQPFVVPSAEEILKALPKDQPRPKNPRIKCELINLRLLTTPPKPGQAAATTPQFSIAHFKCTVIGDQGKEVIVYIEKQRNIPANIIPGLTPAGTLTPELNLPIRQ